MTDIVPTEADRIAAWPYAPACYLKTDYSAWMAGLYDKSAPIIGVFARHAATARKEALEDAAKIAEDHIEAGTYDWGPGLDLAAAAIRQSIERGE